MVLVDGSATVAFTFLVGFFLGAGSASAPGGSAVVTDPLFFLVVVLVVFVAGGGSLDFFVGWNEGDLAGDNVHGRGDMRDVGRNGHRNMGFGWIGGC